MKFLSNHNIKNLSEDFVLNLFASVVSTGILQLVVYPKLALTLGSEGYGQMLTIMGIINVVILSFGNNLCNARIVQQAKYNKNNIIGDFQIIAAISAVVSGIIVLFVNHSFGLSGIIGIGLLVATILQVLKSYYLVAYRIDINYTKNLFANIFLAIGYLIGAFLTTRYLGWPSVFFLSALFSLIYINITSPIIKEPIVVTELFSDSTKTVVFLLLSGLIGNVTTYLDRFIIYPILGSGSVSTYSTAAFFAKSISLVLLPITSVLLSYLAAGRVRINGHRFTLVNLLLIVGAVLFLLVSATVGKWITGLLYPTLIADALPYIVLASIGVIISFAGAFTGIVTLAIAPSYWQVVLAAIKLVLYLVLGVVLTKSCGLFGLCYAVIVTNVIYYIINYFIGNHYVRVKELNEIANNEHFSD